MNKDISSGNNADRDLREQRKQVSKFVKLGKRIGYSLWLIAICLFFVLLFTDFDGPFVVVLLTCLISGCVVLLPSIVLS